jgi:hypothetical protein
LVQTLCPYTNGNVVFQAEAMYRILFADDTTSFDGNCDSDTSTGGRGVNQGVITTNAIQQYKLYPNPNNGSFIIRQSTADITPVSVTIKDVLGRGVFTQSIQFNGGISQLQLSNLPAGVYILQITDANQKISNFKFVIQK